MGAAIWSASYADTLAMPVHAFLHFWRNHGLLQIRNRPSWRTVLGGSKNYVAAIKDTLGFSTVAADVTGIQRREDGVSLSITGQETFHCDAVVIATHADEALALLDKPSDDEQRLLGAWSYSRNPTVFHTDQRVLPLKKRCWASWNYKRVSRDVTVPVSVSYYMNRLQSIQSATPYIVTLNSPEKIEEKEEVSIKQIKEALKKYPNDIAALIIEPIQGEGGDNHFRCQFFEKLRNLADEYEFLLIYDEVQTGIGITGKMWAHQHFTPSLCECSPPVKKPALPDIISFGKKTQVCGILAGERVKEVENNVFKKSSRINSTFGGSLTDMVRFKIILEAIRDFDLLNNAKDNGNYLLNKINDLENEFPAFITNSRGLGLFCAFDLPSSIERDKLTSEAYKNNLLILGCGIKSIRFRPHLTVTKSEIDFAIDVIRKSVSNLLK